jgi:hypothetical protein
MKKLKSFKQEKVEITPELYNALKQEFEKKQKTEKQIENIQEVTDMEKKSFFSKIFKKQEIPKSNIISKEIQKEVSNLLILPKKCPVCNSRLTKSKVIQEGNYYKQILMCKKGDFAKEYILAV